MFSQLTSYGFSSNGTGSSPGGSAAPPDMAIQYNDGEGQFGGSSTFLFDYNNNRLELLGTATIGAAYSAGFGLEITGVVDAQTLLLKNVNPLLKFWPDGIVGGINSGAEIYQDGSGAFRFNANSSTTGFVVDPTGKFTAQHGVQVNYNGSLAYGATGLVLNDTANGGAVVLQTLDSQNILYLTTTGGAATGLSLLSLNNPNDGSTLTLNSGTWALSAGTMSVPGLSASGRTFLADAIDIGVNYSDVNVAFSLQSSKNYIFNMYGAGASIKMALSQTGRLGVGTGAPSANVHVKNYAANNIGQIVQGFAAQSVNLSEWWNSANVANTWIDPDGKVFIAGEAPDATIWKLQVGRSGEAGRVKFIGNDEFGVMIQNGSGKAYIGSSIGGDVILSTSTGTKYFQAGLAGTVVPQPANVQTALRAAALEFASYAVNNSFMMENMYYDSAVPGYVLRNTGYGGLFQFYNGGFVYTGASSGAAGTPAVLTAPLFAIDGPGATSGRTRIEGQTGIGVTPAASAKLQVDSTTQGFAPPRMTTTQKNAISSPMESLMVYDITLHQMSYYNGTTWVNF